MPTDDKTYYNSLTDPPIPPPQSGEEIYVRDASGRLKVLRDGELVDVEPTVQGSAGRGQGTGASQQPGAVSQPQSDKLQVTSYKLQATTDPQVETVIKQSGVMLASSELQGRLRSIVRSRIKNARSAIQMKETLVRGAGEGGLGLSIEQAEKIVRLANALVDADENRSRPVPAPADFQRPAAPVQLASAVQVPTQPPKASIAIPQVRPPVATPPAGLPMVRPQAAPPPPTGQKSPLTPMPLVPVHRPSAIKAEAPVSKPTVQQSVSPVIPVAASNPHPSPFTLNPAFKSKLTGPIEELRGLTLVDFRKLGPNPAACADKVLEKISLLEAESFGKKIEGSKAWKASEVNRLYIEMGDQSLEKGVPIQQLVAQRQAAQLPALSVDEFEAVMDLNKRLRA